MPIREAATHSTGTRTYACVALLAVLWLACRSDAAIITNAARPIDRELRVRLIQTRSTSGGVAAPAVGGTAQRRRIERGVDQILGQAGIEVRFEPEIVPFSNNNALNGGFGSLARLLSEAGGAGVLSPDPRTINLVFVNRLPGGVQPGSDFQPTGMALNGGNGIAFYTESSWLTNTYPTDQDNIAAVIAHELAHNIGSLSHQLDAQNLMRLPQLQVQVGGGIVDYARLNGSQIDAIRRDSFDLLVDRSADAFADYNNDGLINAADYTVWRDTAAGGDPFDLTADGNRDRRVDDGDLAYWSARLGRRVNVDAASLAVPEPTALAVFFMTILTARSAVRPGRVGILA